MNRNYEENRIYQFDDLDWQYAFLKHTAYHSAEEAKEERSDIDSGMEFRKRGRFGAHGNGWLLRSDRHNILLSADRGKVTDAGYDQILALYLTVPVNRYVSISARVRISRFASVRSCNGQEAFGIFVRDTVRADSVTGMHYSNMAAAGGWRGGLCLYGRKGVLENSTEAIHVFCRPIKVEAVGENDVAGDSSDISRLYEITVRVEDGRVLGGLSCLPVDRKRKKNESTECTFQAAEISDMFLSEREENCYYAGFLVARGTEIEVERKSVRVLFHERRVSQYMISGKKAAVTVMEKPVPMPEFRLHQKESRPEMMKEVLSDGRVCYVSAHALDDGNGTRERPFTLSKVLQMAGSYQKIILLPGKYDVQDDIMLEKEWSGYRDSPHILCRMDDMPGEVLLDFGGTSHALKLHADYWIIDGITVTGGMGIQVQGSHNVIRNCMAACNLETGILIRHADIGTPGTEWPADNLVENCISCRNVDRTGQNADGFACKVAAGEGNRFVKCVAFLNADDGFDLFAKNRRIGAVLLEECCSFLNGFSMDENGELMEERGNGNGFKLGGSGLAIAHTAAGCRAERNKGNGFASNSNPWMYLIRCSAHRNRGQNIRFFFSGKDAVVIKELQECDFDDTTGPSM